MIRFDQFNNGRGAFSIAIFVVIVAILRLIYQGAPHQTLACSVLGMCAEINVQGFVSPGFEGVRDILYRHVASGAELGGRATLYSQGKLLFDVWGGFTRPDHLEEWKKETLSLIFSCTKAVTTLVTMMLVDRGLVDLNSPVASYWPEFAANGKEHITVGDCLRHEGGLVRWDRPMTHDIASDINKLTKFIEEMKIDAEFGRGVRAYHALTYGYVPAALVHKLDPKHRTIGQFIRDEISKPLNLDLFLGLPEDFPRSRLAYITDGNPIRAIWDFLLPYFVNKFTGIDFVAPKFSYIHRFFDNLLYNESSILHGTSFQENDGSHYGNPANPHEFNREERLALENGAALGVSNAGALAKLGALVANGGELDGVRLFNKKETLDLLYKDPVSKYDAYLCLNTTFTRGGVSVFGRDLLVDFPFKGYGWGGWGGSVFSWNPENNISFSYTMAGMNLLIVHPVAREVAALVAERLKLT